MDSQVFSIPLFETQAYSRKDFSIKKLSGNSYIDSVNETRIFFKIPSAKNQNMLNDIIARWIKAKIINIKWNYYGKSSANEIKERIKSLRIISSFCKNEYGKKLWLKIEKISALFFFWIFSSAMLVNVIDDKTQ